MRAHRDTYERAKVTRCLHWRSHQDPASDGESARKTLRNLSERNHRRVISVVVNSQAGSKRHVADPTPVKLTPS